MSNALSWRQLIPFLLAATVFAQLPDSKLTPGKIRTSDASEICARSFTTRDERHTTEAMKKQVCAEYHVKHCPWAKIEELDHLVPLELGGADDIENLWVQLAVYPDGSPGFHVKDKLENFLHREVCAGHMTLPEAQQCIMSNWIECYQAHPPR